MLGRDLSLLIVDRSIGGGAGGGGGGGGEQ